MKNVNVFKVMFAIVIALGLALTANAQQPVDPKTGKPFAKTAPTKTTKPMTESEWLKQNQPKTKSTADNQPVTQPQTIVIQEPVTPYPQKVSYPVDYQWVQILDDGNEYTIVLSTNNSDMPNYLTYSVRSLKLMALGDYSVLFSRKLSVAKYTENIQFNASEIHIEVEYLDKEKKEVVTLQVK